MNNPKGILSPEENKKARTTLASILYRRDENPDLIYPINKAIMERLSHKTSAFTVAEGEALNIIREGLTRIPITETPIRGTRTAQVEFISEKANNIPPGTPVAACKAAEAVSVPPVAAGVSGHNSSDSWDEFERKANIEDGILQKGK